MSVWEIKTGKRMMEFSVTGDQQVELTTMCLDESERCLLTGLRDGTIKMWNYTVGEHTAGAPRVRASSLLMVASTCRDWN